MHKKFFWNKGVLSYLELISGLWCKKGENHYTTVIASLIGILL